MEHNLKHRVLLLLKLALTGTDKYDLFNQAFELYKATPEKSPAVEVKLNRIGFTDDGLANLLYDLQKVHGISDTEIHTAVSPAELKAEEIKIAQAAVTKLQSAKRPNKKAIATAQAVVNDLKEELALLETPEVEEEEEEEEQTPVIPLNPNSQEGITSLANKILGHTEVPEGAPADYKFISGEELQPIREQYAFLNEPNCPDVMFTVVGKAISAYRKHQGLHAKLQEVLEEKVQMSAEDQAKLAADTQEAFAENRALWDEMNYYNEHKEILGKHPLFRELVAKREVDEMTNDQLAKYRTSSATFISKKNTELKKAGLSEEKIAELKTAIADREYKLGLVNTKLGADGKK